MEDLRCDSAGSGDSVSPKRRQTAQASPALNHFGQNSEKPDSDDKESSYVGPPGSQTRKDHEIGIIIEGASSEESAFAFLASQESNNLHIMESPDSDNQTSMKVPSRASKLSEFSPISNLSLGLAKPTEYRHHNSTTESFSERNAEGDSDELCRIQFDVGAPNFRPKRPQASRSAIDRLEFKELLLKCKEAFLLSDASDQIEKVLVHLALIGGALTSMLSVRMLLGSFFVLLSAGVERLVSTFFTFDDPARFSSVKKMKEVFNTLGLTERLMVYGGQAAGLSLLLSSSPALLAVYASYLSVQQMVRVEAERQAPTILVLPVLIRLLYFAIFSSPDVQGESQSPSDFSWIQNFLALLLIIATWITAAKYSTKCEIQAHDQKEQAEWLEKEVRHLRENEKHYFTDNAEAMIVCQINSEKNNLGLPAEHRLARVLRVNKGFNSIFQKNTLQAAFSKRILEPVSSSDNGRLLSLQSAILEALTNEKELFKLYLPGSSTLEFIQLDVAPIMYNEKEAHLVKIQNIGPAINQQNKKMQAIFQEAFISTIQHEQLNPLNSIINLSSLMHDQFTDKVNSLKECDEGSSPGFGSAAELEEAQNTLQWTKIIRSSSIMMQLLNAAILNQGQIDSGKFWPTFDVVQDPTEVVSKLISLFEEHAKSQQLTVRIHPKVEGASAVKAMVHQRGLMMEVALYEQILFNILVNAFKFNKQQGSVEVKLEIVMADQGQSVVLLTTITDSGMGMTTEKKGKLGKMFESICLRESSLQPRPEEARQATSGVGLGYSISKNLASYLGGSIQVKSELNQGTEVAIRLKFDLGPRSGTPPTVPRISSSSFHSIELLQGGRNFIPRSAERAKESPQPELSSIAFQFKQMRNQMSSSSTLKNKPRQKLLVSRGAQEPRGPVISQFMTKQRSVTQTFNSEDSQSRNSFCSSADISEPTLQLPVREMKRQFSHSSKASPALAGWKPQRTTFEQTMDSGRPKSSSAFTSAVTQKSISEISSDEESNFGNLTERISPAMILDRLQQNSESTIKTKSSLNQQAKVSSEVTKSQELSGFHQITPSAQHEAKPRPQSAQAVEESPDSKIPSKASQQRAISESSDSDDEEIPASQLNLMAKQLSLKERTLPMLQQILEDKEEDKSSVSQLTYRKKKEPKIDFTYIKSSSSSDSEDVAASLEEDFLEAEEKAANKLMTPQNSQKRLSRYAERRVSTQKEPLAKSCTASVLLVDDSHFNIATLEVMINIKFSIKCLIARNGQEAVDLFKKMYVPPSAMTCPHCERPSCEFRGIKLIFMDLNMPVMDGFEAAEKILAAQDQDSRCSVVALTAFSDPKTLERCLRIGMKEVLAKPASQLKISETIVKYSSAQAKKKAEQQN